jgi:hypothetical protein
MSVYASHPLPPAPNTVVRKTIATRSRGGEKSCLTVIARGSDLGPDIFECWIVGSQVSHQRVHHDGRRVQGAATDSAAELGEGQKERRKVVHTSADIGQHPETLARQRRRARLAVVARESVGGRLDFFNLLSYSMPRRADSFDCFEACDRSRVADLSLVSGSRLSFISSGGPFLWQVLDWCWIRFDPRMLGAAARESLMCDVYLYNFFDWGRSSPAVHPPTPAESLPAVQCMWPYVTASLANLVPLTLACGPHPRSSFSLPCGA